MIILTKIIMTMFLVILPLTVESCEDTKPIRLGRIQSIAWTDESYTNVALILENGEVYTVAYNSNAMQGCQEGSILYKSAILGVLHC